MIPSLLVFGPQVPPPPEDLSDLRNELLSNRRLEKLYAAVRDLPNFWSRLVRSDPELAQVPGEEHLRDFLEWLHQGGSLPYQSADLPTILVFPLNFLLQVTQYVRFAQSLDANDVQRLVLQRLEHGGVQGFCVGFLGAITVATSGGDGEFVENAIRALRLAVCIGVYVDKDASISKARCVCVQWRRTQIGMRDKVLEILQDFPEVYVPGVIDETSMTITAPTTELSMLTELFTNRGFVVKDVPVSGRFHCSVYDAVVDRIVDFFSRSPDLQFPGPDKLHIAVRSAIDGKVIRQGDLVRHALENTLLKRVDWYTTLKLTMAAMPQERRCIALAGISNQFPPSLMSNPDIELLFLRGARRIQAKTVSVPKHLINGFGNHCDSPPESPDSTNGVTKTNGTNGVKTPCVSGPKNDVNSQSNITEALLPDFPPHAIAVVGMAGRFPGAASVEELWDLMASGRSTVAPAPERIGLQYAVGDYAQTKWWGNFLDDFDAFDHKFFRKSAREAIACDPQQRKLLEVVYEALESSGYFGPKAAGGSEAAAAAAASDYGCYVGCVQNNYVDNVGTQPPTAYAITGTGRCFVSGAVSHHFGWTGPALTIDTACSSSLVAVHTACRAIWSGECSRAVVGGSNIITCPLDYRDLKAAGFLSPTGQCKPFDANGDGYCRGEAVGVVVLKSLASAIEENDNILGVITGSAANQNFNEAHITVPNAASQANVQRKVAGMSNISPADVTYVEAHGTGTGVGDPIEVCSLRKAFGGPSRSSTLHFSSIKGNIGHAEAAAGVAGLIKVLLMLNHGQIPPQVSFQSLNPNIPALEPDKMTIPRQLTPWHPSRRVACVNSYGAAGSNCAVMVCGVPVPVPTPNANLPSRLPLILSAATKSSLALYGQKLLEWLQHLESQPDVQVADVLFNLTDRANHSLPNVVSASVSDMSDLKSKLAAVAADAESSAITTVPSPKPVIMIFGGQESLFVGLSQAVYESCRIFRHHLDSCHALAVRIGLEGLYPAIFQQTPIPDLTTLHVALFAVQYASARVWMDCGLKVEAVVGHSFGQLTALCVSGVLSLSDALNLVAGRASMMQTHWGPESGAMMSIQADRQKVLEILDHVKLQIDYAEIACFNGPRSHVIVGSSKAIQIVDAFIAGDKELRDSIRTARLGVTQGFHSIFTEALLPYLTDLASQLEWRSPTMHLETCDEMPMEGEPDSRIVAHHTRHPVYFHQAIERLEKKYPQATWLEAGRGSSIIQLARACVKQPERHSLLAPQLTTSSAPNSLVDVTIKLWKEGHSVQYWPFHRSQRSEYRYLSLPPYQFQKTRHWLPYAPTAAHGREVTNGVKPEEPKRHKLLSLSKGDRPGESIFQISPRSERFQTLSGGHVMCGHALMPASLYVEVASRAALMLQDDLKAATWLPSVEHLDMKSPIGLDLDSDITMTMKRLANPWPLWSFSVAVRAQSSGSMEPKETTTGCVHLSKRDEARVAQKMKRFQTLIGPNRWEQIMNHPNAEKMHGKHIYRAFNQIVEYSEAFWGIKTIACLGSEAAGKVSITPDAQAAADQRLSDTPMVDSFMQFGGFLVNYFNEAVSPNIVFLCYHVEHIEIGPEFSPDARDWFVYANMTTDNKDQISVDSYVFDARSGKVVFTALGMNFWRTPRHLLARLLNGVNRSDTSLETEATDSTKVKGQATWVMKEESVLSNEATQPDKRGRSSCSKRKEIIRITASVADIEVEELSGETTLTDIGIDSLGATELVSDITSSLNVSIDLSTLLLFPDLDAIIAHVDSQLGLVGDDDGEGGSLGAVASSPAETARGQSQGLPNETCSGSSANAREKVNGIAPSKENPSEPDISARPGITSAYECFNNVRLSYDQLGAEAHALDYWSEIYPDDVRLIQVYVTEALKKLGCDLAAISPGDVIPGVTCILPRHRQLMCRLHRFLEDEGIVESSARGIIRSNAEVDSTPSEQIFNEILPKHPLNAAVRHLIRAVGSQLAECLKGDNDGLQIVFGNKTNKKFLDDLYENWPMLVTATQLLGAFLLRAFISSSDIGTFRILEVGAGTGGTTRYIVNLLKKQGIRFEYHFTDISGSLIQKAKRSFKDIHGMTFGVLDIEQEPPPEFVEAFHVIISTNCIHATRNLRHSLTNLRKMLREDGALTLIEMTNRSLYIFDIIVGLLEGWWLFEDGRTYALADEKHWEWEMLDSGFEDVLCSDGESLEAKTVRVIAGFRKGSSAPRVASDVKKNGTSTRFTMQEVVYKTVQSKKIHADIYCPENADPAKKMPIALMIHGGSHILFSRKDIRPPQTRIMLDMGLLPVSLDHRLCPETKLVEGPMVDVCDALEWAREKLPYIELKNPNIKPDPERVVVVGWSSGGQLALSTGWTAPQRGLKPPSAILAFYCPTDYEDEWWQTPIQPIGAKDRGEEYDVLEAVQDEPLTNYGVIGAWEPLSDPRIRTDPRSRIVLHMNWKAQTLPIVMRGLPSRARAARERPDVAGWNSLPQPPVDEIRRCSPLAQVRMGNYAIPTFMIHGTADDLIPWQQSVRTVGEMKNRGIEAQLVLVPDGPHVCDTSNDPESAGWQAVLKAYRWLEPYV